MRHMNAPLPTFHRLLSTQKESHHPMTERMKKQKKSHKISGKNNFLYFDINDDDAWLNVYVIVEYKVKHKNMFSIKSTVFIRFYFEARRKKSKREMRIIEWCKEFVTFQKPGPDVISFSQKPKADSGNICEKISNGVMYYFMSLEPQ